MVSLFASARTVVGFEAFVPLHGDTLNYTDNMRKHMIGKTQQWPLRGV